MKIYIASSWKMKKWCIYFSEMLMEKGHEVYCFCDPSSGYVFHWSEVVEKIEDINAIDFLADPRTQKAFEADKNGLDWADLCLLILPSGKSAHLEAGYMKGKGKKLFIFGEFKKGEFDVMYGFADGLFESDDICKLFKAINETRL